VVSPGGFSRLLLILSEHSTGSEWVNTEIAKARNREVKEGKRVLFPVRLVVLRGYAIGSASTGIRGKIRRARYGSISFPTSATGKTTTRIKQRFRGWSAISRRKPASDGVRALDVTES
jgi:hypothetical protein